ncbi:MAG TPA: adenylate/guanylate cyclase domain-containing protein, partial [Candidatus Acidoferrales bacterium]|nr:adenylate/guanylate cyclase domain-containing protein [Candidatus Acidoferrales bacterium]
MRCTNCGADNPAGTKFCGNCATPLRNRCASCGFENPPNFKFCGECGMALSSSPAVTRIASPPATPVGVRVSPEPAELSVPEGERKTVTALFADIKGSMDLMEDLDPEQARAIIDPALKLMIDGVHRYDGYIVQSTGDGIFALFGAPVAHEDHAQRSLFAALRLQEDMTKYSAELRKQGNPPIEIRIGVNTGEVVVQSIRTDDAHTEYTPIGHSTSLAARMQTLAPTGSIVVTEQTQKLVAGYFDLKALGPARVKGVSEPIDVYEVLGVGPLRSRLQRSESRGLSKFVGRVAEMEELGRALGRARDGHGQIVAAMAEAGVGKSRLFHEFKLRSGGDALVLEAFSVSHGKASSYLPVVDLLKSYFRIADRDDERTRREKVTGKVLALDRALEETLPHLFALLAISADDAAFEEMDRSIRRRRTRDAVKHLILRESLNQPLLLIFEDLHWIDSESEEVLNLLADSIGTARILMLVNYRPEYRHQWGNKTYYTQLRLDPLGPANAGELLSAMLGDSDELQPLKKMIVERTEGNPFFIEEMVQVLFENGVLTRDVFADAGSTASVKLAKPFASIQVPPTVKGILAARIDKLAPDDKDMLQTLAVIGKEFPLGLLRRVIAKSDDALTQTLASLQLGEFIYEQPAFPESEYTFKHALTQEVAYDSVLIERRRQIHERTAAAIEELFAATLDDHVADLANHFSRSGNASKAVNYLRRAAEQSRTRSAYADAIRYAREALALIPSLPDAAERDRLELSTLVMLGPLLIGTQGYSAPELKSLLVRAHELSQRVGESPQVFAVLFGLWGFHYNGGRVLEGRAAAQRLLTMAERVGSELATGGANAAMGTTLLWMGEFRGAREHLARAIAFYDRDIQRYLPMNESAVIPSRGQMSWTLWITGSPDQARARIDEAVEFATQLRRPFSLAFALTFAISLAHLLSDYEKARSKADALIELAR